MSTEVQTLLISLFNNAPINKTLGVTLEYNPEGEAICRWARNPDYDHGGHDTHGGIIATLLDSAGWFTASAQCGQAVVTSDLHVRLLQAAKQQALVATARIVRMGAKSIVAEMKVTSPSGLVAIATAAFTKVGELPAR
jgi:uncharacterized protein (TIGR00369 family)